MKTLYVIVDENGSVAVKCTDNKLGVFVRRGLAEKNLHLYSGTRIVEVNISESDN